MTVQVPSECERRVGEERGGPTFEDDICGDIMKVM
jgi:hypothetical protein